MIFQEKLILESQNIGQNRGIHRHSLVSTLRERLAVSDEELNIMPNQAYSK